MINWLLNAPVTPLDGLYVVYASDIVTCLTVVTYRVVAAVSNSEVCR
jgi:hypothetical protein